MISLLATVALAAAVWTPITGKDSIDDTVETGAHLETDGALLGLNCIGGRLNAVVMTVSFLGNTPRHREVSFRFDQQPAVSFNWNYQYSDVAETDNVGLLRLLVAGFHAAKSLHVRVYDDQGLAMTYDFALPSDAGPIDAVLNSCAQKLD